MLRVLIFGSRDLDEGPGGPVWPVLSGLLRRAAEELEVIEGGATGADAAAREWLNRSAGATPNVVGGRTFPADWYGPCGGNCEPGHRRRNRHGADYCPAAGPRRNEAMADYLASHDGPVQAWGFVNKPLRQSHGSFDMAMRLWAHRVPCQIVQVVTPPAKASRNVSEAFAGYRGAM